MRFFHFSKSFFIFVIVILTFLGLSRFLSRNTDQEPVFLIMELETLSKNVFSSVAKSLEKYFLALSLYEENEELRLKQARLESRFLQMDELKAENERLKILLDLPKSPAFRLIPAQVRARDFFGKNDLLTINKGRRHGVKKFMGVLHPSGVVGYVFRTNPFSSQVLILLSPLSSLPVKNEKHRSPGLLLYGLDNLLKFRPSHLENGSLVSYEKGELLLTSLSDQFPAGLPAGKIISVEKKFPYGPEEILVKPMVSFENLEEVLILAFKEEKKEEEEEEENK